MDIKQMFIDYLFANYSIGNGDMLTELQENSAIQDEFIRKHNLSDDVELY